MNSNKNRPPESRLADIDSRLRNPLCQRLHSYLESHARLDRAIEATVAQNFWPKTGAFRHQAQARFWSKLQQDNGRRISQALRESALIRSSTDHIDLDSAEQNSLDWLQGRFIDPNPKSVLALRPNITLQYAGLKAKSEPLAYLGEARKNTPIVIQACHASYNGSQTARHAVLNARREAALHTLAIIHALKLAPVGSFEAILIFRQPGSLMGKALRLDIGHEIAQFQASDMILSASAHSESSQNIDPNNFNYNSSCSAHCPSAMACCFEAENRQQSIAYGYHLSDLLGDCELVDTNVESQMDNARFQQAYTLYCSIFPELVTDE